MIPATISSFFLFVLPFTLLWHLISNLPATISVVFSYLCCPLPFLDSPTGNNFFFFPYLCCLYTFLCIQKFSSLGHIYSIFFANQSPSWVHFPPGFQAGDGDLTLRKRSSGPFLVKSGWSYAETLSENEPLVWLIRALDPLGSRLLPHKSRT